MTLGISYVRGGFINKIMKIVYKGNIYEHFNYKNPIPGGIGDNLKKYNKKQLELGIKVEKEHIGKNKAMTAKEKRAVESDIAKDHLEEIPDYYTRLIKMEKDARKELGLKKDD
jgi:hypothetical protein